MENCIVSFEEFVRETQEAVASKVSGSVSVKRIQKNNGVMRSGLTIFEENANMSPTLYLENYYEYYREYGMEQTVRSIIAAYERNKLTGRVDVTFFTDIEKLRPKIKMKLINYERNAELLKELPHIRFLNLAIVFSAIVRVYEEGAASILINNHHMNFWNMDASELYRLAMENTKNDYEIISMETCIRELDANYKPDGLDESGVDMYILSNHLRLFGAAGVLHKDILRDFMKEKHVQKLVILPSSTHEVILITGDDNPENDALNNLVREVNETQLMPEDILSDNAYVFDGSDMYCLE